MKKAHTTMISVIVLAILSLVVSARGESDVGWFRSRFGNLSWAEVRSVVKEPREICSRVRHRVKYISDVGEEWASGVEAWDRGYGDCEDIAAAVVGLCREVGVEADIVIFYPEGGLVGHAVVVGEWRGKRWISSNGWFRTVKSMEGARRDVAKEMGWDRRKVRAMQASVMAPRTVTVGRQALAPVRWTK